MSINDVLSNLGDGSSSLLDVLIALRDRGGGGESSPDGVESKRLLHQVPKYVTSTISNSCRFDAVITGSKPLEKSSSAAGKYKYRWLYTFKEVVFKNDGEAVIVDKGRSGNAYNLSEMAHESGDEDSKRIVWGVDIEGDSYKSTSLAPRPVGGGGKNGEHKQDVLVEITTKVAVPATDAGGEETITIFTFDRVGSHDGSCIKDE